RRDVLVLGPLPVRPRTMFLAKVASVATGLGLVVLIFHAIAGIAWPLAFHIQAEAQTVPILSYERAMPPVDAASMQPVLARDLRQRLAPGEGMAVGVWQRGVSRLFTFGDAQIDARF